MLNVFGLYIARLFLHCNALTQMYFICVLTNIVQLCCLTFLAGMTAPQMRPQPGMAAPNQGPRPGYKYTTAVRNPGAVPQGGQMQQVSII